jgi:hypothetical protein
VKDSKTASVTELAAEEGASSARCMNDLIIYQTSGEEEGNDAYMTDQDHITSNSRPCRLVTADIPA